MRIHQLEGLTTKELEQELWHCREEVLRLEEKFQPKPSKPAEREKEVRK